MALGLPRAYEAWVRDRAKFRVGRLVFLSIALWWGLGYLMGNAWSAVVVAVLWGVVTLILALTGKKQIEEIAGVPQTVETVKEIPETLKRNEENR